MSTRTSLHSVDRTINTFTSIDLSHDWRNYVTVKAKGVRCAVFAGGDVMVDGVTIPNAAGYLELIGARTGLSRTRLRVGFTFSPTLPAPSFHLSEGEAVGTTYLPAACFSNWVDIAKGPQAYFRVGGDGRLNALATDHTLLQIDQAGG